MPGLDGGHPRNGGRHEERPPRSHRNGKERHAEPAHGLRQARSPYVRVGGSHGQKNRQREAREPAIGPIFTFPGLSLASLKSVAAKSPQSRCECLRAGCAKKADRPAADENGEPRRPRSTQCHVPCKRGHGPPRFFSLLRLLPGRRVSQSRPTRSELIRLR